MAPSMNENMNPNWLNEMGSLSDNFTSRQIIMIVMMLMIDMMIMKIMMIMIKIISSKYFLLSK